MRTVPITEVAAVLRSKNAGPYEWTFDILFREEGDYLFLKELDFFTREFLSGVYGVPADRVRKVIYFDPAWAVKFNVVRPTVSGAVGDTDVYGAQQHAPLLGIQVPVREG